MLQKNARVFVVICQATINNNMQGVGTSVMSGFHGSVRNNEMPKWLRGGVGSQLPRDLNYFKSLYHFRAKGKTRTLWRRT